MENKIIIPLLDNQKNNDLTIESHKTFTQLENQS